MIEYNKVISPTKFNTVEELALFLSESYYWDREWAGLKYNRTKWEVIWHDIVSCERKIGDALRKRLATQEEIKEKVIFPFWVEELKQYYTFPLYLKRECLYASGGSTEYWCSILTKKRI